MEQVDNQVQSGDLNQCPLALEVILVSGS
jgi:hypothetical protein